MLPPWQVDGLLEDYAHCARGEAAAVTDVVPRVTGHPARSFAFFAADHAGSFPEAATQLRPGAAHSIATA